ncbi:hypothetical protein J3459_017417 [Metarhizium acridum]|nr:hypothetical protein J3459_017417 [Metarhizium acridum]
MRWLQLNKTRYLWLDHKEGDEFARDACGIEDGCNNSEGRIEDKHKHSGLKQCLFVSLLLNGSLMLLVAILWWRDRRLHSRDSDLLPTPVPEFPTEVRTFQLDPLFLSLPSEESNTAWESLPGPQGALRKFMWDLMYGRVHREALLATWPANVSSPTYDQAINGMWHYAHCFDYLRQGIQCSGDTSLEFVHGGTGRAVVDGLAYPHVCKNWDALWAYAKLHG